jgi:hypothetical protein
MLPMTSADFNQIPRFTFHEESLSDLVVSLRRRGVARTRKWPSYLKQPGQHQRLGINGSGAANGDHHNRVERSNIDPWQPFLLILLIVDSA